MIKTRRISPIFFAAFASSMVFSGCGRQNEPVLANIGSDAITATEFKQELSRQPFAREDYMSTLPGRKELLELLIRRKVILAESKKTGLEDRPEIKEQLAQMEKEIERQRQEARERLIVGEYFRELQQNSLKVSDEDVKKFWEQEKEVRASHVLVTSSAAAQQVLSELSKGAKFDAVAKKYSEDPGSAQKGGDLGYFMKGTLVPEFERSVFALKEGETSGVVPSPYGFHVIRKTGERPLSERPFDQAKDVLRSVLEKQKFQSWIDQTKTKYKISMNLPALEKLEMPARPAPKNLPR
jgi:peptidyl-prolyl cis-trans isomerase C